MELTNVIRIFVTVAGLVCFLAIVLWAYGKPAKRAFDEAAMQPIADDDSASAGLGVNK
jgi:cytochrome c oxidase cbb3-type subunit 4